MFDRLGTGASGSPTALEATQLLLQGLGQPVGVFHGIELDHAGRLLDGIGVHGLDILANPPGDEGLEQ